MALARMVAAEIGPLALCRLPPGTGDIAAPILDSVVSNDRIRAARFSVDRLASRRSDVEANVRKGLRREWTAPCDDGAFVLYDAYGALATPAGADVLGELAHTLPARRRLLIVTRVPLPPALQAAVTLERTIIVGRDDLALSGAEVATAVRLAGLENADAAELFAAAGGWPLVTEILIDLIRSQTPDDIVEALRALPDESFLAFAAHRLIARLPERVREALVTASFFEDARYVDIVRILGPECDDAVFARMITLPVVTFDGECVQVHPFVTRLLRERFGSVVEPLYERALSALSNAGRHVVAAQIALDAGDGLRAAELIDAARPFTAGPVPIPEYERVLHGIDPAVITRFSNVWIATIPYRSFSVDPSTYIREAETVFFCLPTGTAPDQRAAALMMLVSAYTNVGRGDDGDALLAEALGGSGFASGDTTARTSLLNLRASLRGIDGRFGEARIFAAEAARISRDSFGQNQTLHYIEAHEAAFRGRQDRIVVILDELMLRRGRVEPPLYLVYVAMNGMLFSWVNGDDSAFDRYLTAFEDSLSPAIEGALAPLIDAARGRSTRVVEGQMWPMYATMTHLYQIGMAATKNDALRAARAAVAAADRRGAPYSKTLSHLALYILDEAARPQQRELLDQLTAKIESPEWQAAVRGVLAGNSAGILEPFVRRRVLRERDPVPSRLTVELLANRVTRNGEDMRLRGKEFELISLLASTRGSLSRDEIGGALWGHLDDTEWSNNLKVTLYRIRKAVGTKDVTVAEGARYRLMPSIDVDLRRAEAVVRDRASAPLDDESRAELGTIVASFRDGTIERYERYSWSHGLVARLNDLACACGLALATDALERSQIDEALAFAERVRDIDRLNEKACMIAIRAMHAAGDIDSARREFQRYTADLAREFATVPSISLAEIGGM